MTNPRNSIAINKNWDIQVRNTKFSVFLIQTVDRSWLAFISCRFQWSKIIFYPVSYWVIFLVSALIFNILHLFAQNILEVLGGIDWVRRKSELRFVSGAVQTYNRPETDLVIRLDGSIGLFVVFLKKLISLKLQVIANILSNSNPDL